MKEERHCFHESDVSENSKVYWNEKFCYIRKSRWDVQYPESSVSH